MSDVTRRFARLALALMVYVSGLAAADPLDPLAPLVSGPRSPRPSETLLTDEAAQRALQMGFPSLANQLIEEMLGKPDLPVDLHNELVLDQTVALLDDNRVADAEQALRDFTGPPTAAVHLRAALIAGRQRRFDVVRTELAVFKPDELPEIDRAWFYFLQGLLAESANDFNRSSQMYQQAIDAAHSSVQKARFILAREQSRLALGEATEGQIASYRQNMERYAGRALGYRAVSDLAIALNSRGDRGGAISVLQTQLQNLPREQRLVSDEWMLLLGLIAGPSDGAGRNALRNLLTSGTDRDKQRVALQLLARNATEPSRRDEFQAKLDELIGAARPHPLLEELLLFRAQLALANRKEGQANLTRAEEDVTQLLQRFPGSQLKGFAYGILTNAAWERGQYRNAASLAAKSREQLHAGETRARLGLLVADAYYRANDFVSAAEAYRAALDELPAGVPPGNLIFQEILAEIHAGQLEQAAKLVDDRAKDPRFDPTNRWQAEWDLTRALQADGKTTLAYGRLNQLLDISAEAGAIPPELRARMRWLQAKLSFDVGELQRTVVLTSSLLGNLEGLDKNLKADAASTTMLLQVQAAYALNQDAPSPQATSLLQRLRAEYPNTDAAVKSYLFEADAAARKGLLVEAQTLLTSVAANFPKSPYVPYALYQAAEYVEQRGQGVNYREANDLIERLVHDYPDDDLVFYARLKQGHLMRRLSEFGRAQQAYASLDNDPAFANHPGRTAAQLALADTHAAQAANDPSHLDEAHRIYERLLDLPTAPIALRIEAGYKYGLSLSRHGQTDTAIRVWGLVMNFLVTANGKTDTFGSEGRYWLSRTLLYFGDLLRTEGKLEQAREAYDLVLKSGLPGASSAQEGIVRLQPKPTAGRL